MTEPTRSTSLVLSFDVEEHHRIEAAAGLSVEPSLRAEYARRMETTTRSLLDLLAEYQTKATFYIVGEIARDRPDLIAAVARAGHEVGSHSWEHQCVHRLSPAEFREDTRKSKDALEQAAGTAVVGYRAPTFSIGRRTPWAIDVLAELGFRYDSSIYPVRHDRYGEPDAPRGPFHIRGVTQSLLELPPLTWRCASVNLPVGGGGYFRLLPLLFMERGIAQTQQQVRPPVVMTYFHPWEFDPDQPRLPLRRVSRFRTYVGMRRSRPRLRTLLQRHRFTRAMDVASGLESSAESLPTFSLESA